jgi:FMN phosphatase YigB (HAD superfamily)
LLDESRAWSAWARWLGVSDLTLAGLLGATIARGEDHVEALRMVKPGFFAAIARLVGLEPGEIAYVGDRVDNDVLPARAAGMVAVHLRRGPWGHLQGALPEAREADIRIESLAELPERLAALRRSVVDNGR